MALIKADAIIVLAGGIDSEGNIPRQVKQRLDKGLELYLAGLAPRIIVSGKWSLYYEFQPPITEAEAMKLYLIQREIPAAVILKEENSQSTIGNAYFIKNDLYKPNKWKSAIIVTSDVHMERTQYIFEMVFGTSYQLQFERVPSKLSQEEYEKAKYQHNQSLQRAKKLFAQCKPGQCDERILKTLFDKNTYAETKKLLPKKFITKGKFK
ncbi:YdcF family protein [Candidatus Woesearchaeota archaeon]|nr:YdcF family protein [Candidatus Woesearchaeota archaeon]